MKERESGVQTPDERDKRGAVGQRGTRSDNTDVVDDRYR